MASETPSVLERLREDARALFARGVEAALPAPAVRRALEGSAAGGLSVAGEEVSLRSPVPVLAFGKAAVSMTEAVAERFGKLGVEARGLVVVNRENRRPLAGLDVRESGHPVPDEAGVAAANAAIRLAREARREPLFVVLVSGGGSALLPAPARGLELADKTRTTRALLASGATIGELNTVRKHISRLKGGQLAAEVAPAPCLSLILSDVVGDDLATIASGPTAPDPTTFRDALAVLRRRGLTERVPSRVLEHLRRGERGEVPETPGPGDAIFARVEHRIVGSNGQSLDAAARRARELGYRVEIVSRALEGEARNAAALLTERLRAADRDLPSASRAPLALLCGGETTVTLRGPGRGGRNQEMALALALELERAPLERRWVFLSGGTDGRDGPTDAAGGVVDSGTIARARARGRDPAGDLDRNDSYPALAAAGDLLTTGGTGTNVADLQMLLVE